MAEDCNHELSSWILQFGRIVWICRICFGADGGSGLQAYGCGCDECIDAGRRSYLPLIRENEIERCDTAPSFVEVWLQRIYNEHWKKLDDATQYNIIYGVKKKNGFKSKTQARLALIAQYRTGVKLPS